MTSAIRTVFFTGLLLGASILTAGNAATAQGRGKGAIQRDVHPAPAAGAAVEHAVYQAPVKHPVHKKLVRRSSRVRRVRFLCEDGTWSVAGRASCDSHGGLAARQLTTTTTLPPRASAVARARASTRSRVYRSTYSSTVRAGAIARCNDGTYWHSPRRTNACTGHGGVATWL
ncbi:MAG TPA: DUF3761 domain-containing protein [Gemmatimonadaceae bacterium]|jgi:hypothetical protein